MYRPTWDGPVNKYTKEAITLSGGRGTVFVYFCVYNPSTAKGISSFRASVRLGRHSGAQLAVERFCRSQGRFTCDSATPALREQRRDAELARSRARNEQRNTTGVVTLKGRVGLRTKKTRRAVNGPAVDMGHCTACFGRVSRAR
ncbi:hypothetical protein PoB_004250400 [Plakobranchus ocellatus]|uniref:Uncharacterized protein n=1 Tax=Plakobranchus ocellatus TaxID=259542 RepID=A0AAV4BB96_9GAST|nr:hypothetical protein PoB_004250400 [Plakobranchus ocellatus]